MKLGHSLKLMFLSSLPFSFLLFGDQEYCTDDMIAVTMAGHFLASLMFRDYRMIKLALSEPTPDLPHVR